jgi:hypothetical protein
MSLRHRKYTYGPIIDKNHSLHRVSNPQPLGLQHSALTATILRASVIIIKIGEGEIIYMTSDPIPHFVTEDGLMYLSNVCVITQNRTDRSRGPTVLYNTTVEQCLCGYRALSQCPNIEPFLLPEHFYSYPRKRSFIVTFKVFTAVTMENVVFWYIKTQFVPHRGHITSPLHSPAG